MIRVLIVSVRYGKKSTGGAAKSFINIFRGLLQNQNFELKLYSRTSSKLVKKILDPLGFSYFLYLPLIIRVIKRFNPHIVITQSRIAFSATLAAKIAKVPIVTLVRDLSDICPKYTDIIAYGKACKGLKSREICYQCINYWRSLRVLIGNRPRGWQYTFKAISSTIRYKIRYFASKLNLKVLKLARVVVVASKTMKDILANHIDSKNIKVINITPIKQNQINQSSLKKNQFLFVIPSYEAAHKGLDFILRLSNVIPKEFKLIIVGAIIETDKIASMKHKIINIGHVNKNELDKLYRDSQITFVPSFYTEAFGRVIIESIANKTPVIVSPNCGANSFFINKEFLKEVPLKLSLWKNMIEEVVEKPPVITNDDVQDLYTLFSIKKSKDDLSKIIKDILIETKKKLV